MKLQTNLSYTCMRACVLMMSYLTVLLSFWNWCCGFVQISKSQSVTWLMIRHYPVVHESEKSVRTLPLVALDVWRVQRKKHKELWEPMQRETCTPLLRWSWKDLYLGIETNYEWRNWKLWSIINFKCWYRIGIGLTQETAYGISFVVKGSVRSGMGVAGWILRRALR